MPLTISTLIYMNNNATYYLSFQLHMSRYESLLLTYSCPLVLWSAPAGVQILPIVSSVFVNYSRLFVNRRHTPFQCKFFRDFTNNIPTPRKQSTHCRPKIALLPPLLSRSACARGSVSQSGLALRSLRTVTAVAVAKSTSCVCVFVLQKLMMFSPYTAEQAGTGRVSRLEKGEAVQITETGR